MASRRSCPGFTIIELLAVVGSVGIAGSLATVAFDPGTPAKPGAAPASSAQPEKSVDRIDAIRKKLDALREQIDGIESELDGIKAEYVPAPPALAKARSAARQLKDATQIRGIQQSFIVWATNNKGMYPLPSVLDAAGKTVAGSAASKDTTANIMSILIFGGFISAELCLSPAEANANISIDQDYAFDQPKAAVDPENALWDPAFAVGLTKEAPGNVSYAHLQPFSGRKKMWSDSFSATEAVVANRGPQIESIARTPQNTIEAKAKLANSITYLIHGERDKWEGNVSFNDGHVEYLTSLVPDPASGISYINSQDVRTPDVFFFDETDTKMPQANIYLGMFTKSGPTLEDWNAIWD